MIYELRTYTLQVHRVPEYLELFKEYLPVREKHSKLVGFWHTEIGELNQVVHIWAYEDLAHRTRVRQTMGKDPEWQKVVAKLTALTIKQENKILIPADFSPIK